MKARSAEQHLDSCSAERIVPTTQQETVANSRQNRSEQTGAGKQQRSSGFNNLVKQENIAVCCRR